MSFLSSAYAEKNLEALNTVTREKNKQPKKGNDTPQKQEIKLNPINDYVRNANKLSLPVQQSINFSESNKQVAFLITPPDNNTSLWDIKLTSSDAEVALFSNLRTITFDENNRLIDSDSLLEEKGIGSITFTPQIWPNVAAYLLVGTSSATKVQISIQAQSELSALEAKNYNNVIKAISSDSISKPLRIPWKVSDKKSIKKPWQLKLITEAKAPYQVQIVRKGSSTLIGQTEKSNQLIINNWQPSKNGNEFIIKPLSKRMSRVVLSLEPMEDVSDNNEVEGARFTPLLFDKKMTGSLSHRINRNYVDYDTWQIDLTKPKLATKGLSHIQLSIYADNPIDFLTATLVDPKKRKKIIDLKQRGEINIDSLSLPPAKYNLTVSSTDVGVEYSILAKYTSAPAKIKEQEPNDIEEYANPITPRKPIKGSLSELDLKDYFVLDTNAAGEAQLWRLLASGQGVKAITVDNKYTALKNPKATNQPVAFKQLLLLPGIHHIKVTGTGDYIFRAIPLGAPKEGFEVEPNDGVFGPFQHLEIGKKLTGSLEQIRYGKTLDQDTFRFTVEEEALYRITITPPEDQGIHANLKMYDSTWFDADVDTDAATPLIYESKLFSADYTLIIQNIKDQNALDEYTVLLEKITSENSNVKDADTEPNDRLALSSLLTKTQLLKGSLGNFDQSDYYLLPSSKEITKIHLRGIGNESEFKAKIFDSRGRFLSSKQIKTNTWEIKPQKNEVYFALQVAKSNTNQINNKIDYQMNIEFTPSALPNKKYVRGVKQPPEQLHKLINVAWSGLGAEWEITDQNNLSPKNNKNVFRSLETLNDYVMPHGRGAGWVFKLKANFFKLGLATDKPIPLAGFAINTRMNDRPDYKVRRFDFLVSNDGKNFKQVLSGELDSSHKTQYFTFDKPVTARFIQLVPTQNFSGDLKPIHMKAQELMVFATRSYATENIDLASYKLGGHIVYHTFGGHLKLINALDKALIDPSTGSNNKKLPLCKFPKKKSRIEWVVGFHHNRTAQIETLKYVPVEDDKKAKHFKNLAIQISEKSPLGPWQSLGSWSEQQLNQTQNIQLTDTPWVKFVRFIADGKANTSYHCPGDFIAIERPNSDTYQSILADWGGYSSKGPYEESRTATQTDYTPTGGKTKDSAVKIDKNQGIQSSVKRERNQDWFEFNKTTDDSQNSLLIQLSHPSFFKPFLNIYDETGKQLQLQTITKEGDQNSEVTKSNDIPLGWVLSSYKALLTDSGVYHLNIKEPPRNTLITWDSSGSMNKQLPYIHSSIQEWATYIKPEHEQVKIFTLKGKPFPEKNWANYPYMLQAALELARNKQTRSSNAESALVEAGKILLPEKGNKAVVITADGVSSGDLNFWTKFKHQCPQVYAVGLGGGANVVISTTDSHFSHWQDKFQDWVSACGGNYQYCDSIQCLEDFYEYAASDIRKAKPYQLKVEQIYIKPADPGSLSVVIGKKTLKETSKALYVILDASGSMLNKIDGKYRINIAKKTLKRIVSESIGKHNHFALRTFGLKSKKCHHELTLPVKKLNIKQAKKAIDKIKAISYAKTPIADSLIAAANDLKTFDGEKLIILLTDGEETCDGDSESVLKSLRASGLDIKMLIVGFALNDEKLIQQFKNWSSLGGGKYYDAQNESDLQNALHKAVTPRFEVKNIIGEVIMSGFIGDEKHELPPGKYIITLPDSPEIVGKEIEVISNKNTKAEFK